MYFRAFLCWKSQISPQKSAPVLFLAEEMKLWHAGTNTLIQSSDLAEVHFGSFGVKESDRIVGARLGQAQVGKIQLKVSTYRVFFLIKTPINAGMEACTEQPDSKLCAFNRLKTLTFKSQQPRAHTQPLANSSR